MIDGTSPQSTNVQISGCDISTTYAGAYAVSVSLTANASVMLQNDSIHDSAGGVNVTRTRSAAVSSPLRGHAEPLQRDGAEPDLEQNASGAAISYTGNTISGAGLGVSLYTYNDATTLSHSGNTLSGNTENYGGSATSDACARARARRRRCRETTPPSTAPSRPG